MAAPDLEKLVRIVFSGDASDLAKTVSGIQGGFNTLGRELESATEPFAKIFDSVVKMDAALAALAIGGIAIAIKEAGEFVDSFAEITTLLSGSSGELDSFRTNLLNYAATSTAAFDEITGATYQIISAMGEEVDAIAVLTEAEKLNVAGKGELDATTKLLATSLNAYGADVDEAKDYSDALFTTVKVGVTNLSELSSSLGTVTGLASSAGVPFDDLNAAVGALTGTVGDTSLAVTQVKSILTAIVKPSQQAADEAKRLEIAFNAEALAAEGLDGFLKKVFDATEGNTESMAKLFGRVEGLNGALILGADTSGKYATALEAMENRAGAVEAAFEKMAQKIELSNQKIINSLKALLITAGTPLLDEFKELADGIAGVFSGIRFAFDAGAFDELTGFVEEFMSDIADDLATLATTLPDALSGLDWSGFVDALRELNAAVGGVLDSIFDFDISDADSLRDALQSVIDAFERWVNFSTGLVEGIEPFVAKVVELGEKFLSLDGDIIKSAGEFTSWGKVINAVSGIIPNLTAPLNLLTGAISVLSITQIPAFIKGLGLIAAPVASASAALAPFVALAGTFLALDADSGLGKWLRENSELFNTFATGVDTAIQKVGGFETKQYDARIEAANVNVELGKLIGSLADLGEEIEKVPASKSIDVAINEDLDEFFVAIDQVEWNLNNLKDYEIKIPAEVDSVEKVESDWNTIKVALEDGTVVPIKVDSAKAVTDATKANTDIEKELTDKQVEIKLQGEIDIELEKIKTSAETLQAAFEWEAKVEIANIEADVARIEAMSTVLSDAWKSTGEVLSSAFGVLADVSPGSPAFYAIKTALEEELKIRKAIAESTIALNAAEIEHIKARTDSLNRGDALITITTSGLEPALEQVLYSIVQKAQVKASAEGFSALLGT